MRSSTGRCSTRASAWGQGQCPVKRYNSQLRDLIIRGRATPSLIVSHELPLDQAPDAYDQFDKRVDGWTGKCCGCCSPPSWSARAHPVMSPTRVAIE